MKHYFSYKSNGELVSSEIMDGGFTDVMSFDSDNPHEIIAKIKTKRLSSGSTGFIEYNCPCPSTTGVCQCPSSKFASSFVDNGSLRPRYTYKVLVDGLEIAVGDTIIRAPGTTVNIQLTECNAPDSTGVELTSGGGASVFAVEPVQAIFSSGNTSIYQAVAPAQGLTSGVVIKGDNKLLLKHFIIKGFTV